ncbi:BBP7 family outer membrane beta-barrel protein [Fimbriiglobus ruber]|uniref:Uncharacterized protein n=1 Tax=Fimbriiglobus ruber TaxID=1908690 RepID=A0A225E4Y7_9BACT|nr:BBP7 family outer membrane beta-barrel protein [Fimbriiglobus ruber]OWK43477.1 hypothetical protein FRUB_03076 [Fimbriiglobus ruber]
MKKFILGASMALGVAAGEVGAQQLPTTTQSPAPVVSLTAPPGGTVTESAPTTVTTGDALGASLFPSGGGGAGGGGSGPATRIYTEASYLLMFTNHSNIATPLATGGPALGILGNAGTTTLLGNDSVGYGTMSGIKVGIGGFVGDSRFGFEGDVMYIGRVTDTQGIGPTSSMVVARPFYDPVTKQQNSVIIAAPGAYNGAIEQNAGMQVWGFETNPFIRLAQGGPVTFDLITGFRFFQETESLNLYSASTLLPGGVTAFDGLGLSSGSVSTHDLISTRNQFYGGQVGGRMSYATGRWFLDLTGKIAIGGVREVVNVNGSTTLTNGPLVAPTSTAGGFYGSGNYLGQMTQNKFGVLPELNLQLGFQVTSWMNVFAGYQLMYLNHVARPGDQLNANIAVSQLPTSPTYSTKFPTVSNGITDADLWLHGFNFGLTLTY